MFWYYCGNRYLFLKCDEVEINIIILIKWRFRCCVMRIFVVLLLCGFGVMCGYFIFKEYIFVCKVVLLGNNMFELFVFESFYM